MLVSFSHAQFPHLEHGLLTKFSLSYVSGMTFVVSENAFLFLCMFLWLLLSLIPSPTLRMTCMEIKIRCNSLYNVYFMVFDPPAIQNQHICISAEESSHTMSLVPGNQQFAWGGHPIQGGLPIGQTLSPWDCHEGHSPMGPTVIS